MCSPSSTWSHSTTRFAENMSDLTSLLVAYRDATGCEAAVWDATDQASATLIATSSDSFASQCDKWVISGELDRGLRPAAIIATRFGAENECWLVAEQSSSAGATDIRILAAAAQITRKIARERDGATRELTERYEEINLLYAISELLGGDIPVEVAAGTLLKELAVTIGADTAVFLLADHSRQLLVPVATLGLDGRSYPELNIRDETHIAAQVFSTGSALSVTQEAAKYADPVLAEEGGAVLAAAITRTNTVGDLFIQDEVGELLYRTRENPADMRPLGVVLFGRNDANMPFSAGDRKLVVAVASQLGTALHNASLMRTAVEREQFAREMRLAHHLQLKLLPDPSIVAPEARAAAKVISADSVGGDFFLLVRLDANRTGVLIGDVSGHGYQAALVMALALSAAGIHIRAANSPADTLNAVANSLRDELESTEMSLTLFYCVIDAASGTLSYANAGHPHAFHHRGNGEIVRLQAQSLPIGFVNETVLGESVTWDASDRLVCFTDGVSDVRNTRNKRLGEGAILDVVRNSNSNASPTEILSSILDVVSRHRIGTTLRDDITVVVVDRVVA